ncbi:hypothetical protein Q9L42_020195 (plasmid) [Methylomarinum sp. Ch1-1]|uniref:Uncharacterized protein n=1 Tax=Methylomarinum roseum TaxID=3067653 RepID=A0AAU7P0G3_9GAMM|nr:hypothetical protein [Methylomarinum sp. Ch1-1]MDP4523235.1 hypothetical protein [Methylomarinum sp. Ch1-1]
MKDQIINIKFSELVNVLLVLNDKTKGLPAIVQQGIIEETLEQVIQRYQAPDNGNPGEQSETGKKFIERVARMNYDGEERPDLDEEGDGFIMENDNAVSTLSQLIIEARALIGESDEAFENNAGPSF